MSTDRDVRDLFADCLRKLYEDSGCDIPDVFDPFTEANRIKGGILSKDHRIAAYNSNLNTQYQFVELALRALPFLDEISRDKESVFLLTEYIYPILKETK